MASALTHSGRGANEKVCSIREDCVPFTSAKKSASCHREHVSGVGGGGGGGKYTQIKTDFFSNLIESFKKEKKEKREAIHLLQVLCFSIH